MGVMGWSAEAEQFITVDGVQWRGWRVRPWERVWRFKLHSPFTLTLWLPAPQEPSNETVLPLIFKRLEDAQESEFRPQGLTG